MQRGERHGFVLALVAAALVTVAACGQAQPNAEPPAEQHPITKDIGTGVEVSITLPQGWSGEPRGGYVCGATCDGPAGAGIIAFNDREYFAYGDPCRWSTSRPKADATTAEVLVEQLAKQTRRVASGSESVTVDGRTGKKIILEMAEDVKAEGDVFTGCDDDKFALLGVTGEDPGRWSQGEGQVEEVWAVDVDGVIAVLIGIYFPETPQEDVDAVRGALASMTFSNAE
jgi:predicted small lipoprotein YifL